ncbi:MAG: hypothetical protein COT84_07105 [Chlamydiae bacterium CG10_big_fil_rev_8_21_14_0_10_35_9]|nr:MAG: hypothetical protein COT84_07105 [Chlamydiae bacterium CG10_big_fil_rev_8_21_14_0_10_35_9]
MSFVFLNGEFIPSCSGKVADSEFLHRQGVFTTILVKEGKAFFLHNHIKRINRHCKKSNILAPYISIRTIKELLMKNNAYKGLYRLKILVAAEVKDLQKNTLLITLEKEAPNKSAFSLCKYIRPAPFASNRVKSLAYCDRLALRKFANSRGFDDCLTFDMNKYLLETSVANVFWIKNNSLHFPDPKLLYFRGIVLTTALVIAKKLKMKVQYGKYTIKDLSGSHLFYCNSMKGILPVKSLENTPLSWDLSLQNTLLEQYMLFSKEHWVDLTV